MQHSGITIVDKHTAAESNLAEIDYQEGRVLLMNKPYGWTSFQLVKKVKYHLARHYGVKKFKVGHAGTLDPLATGLMILCTGRMTKSLAKYQGLDKEYLGEMKLGAITPSFDKETEEIQSLPADHITSKQIREVFHTFTGEQKQYPPVFSAKKINGQRAYKKARKGEDVEMRPSVISIHNLELEELNQPFVRFRVYSSKGTYIRTLVKDIGEALQSGAYLTALQRTKIGSFALDDAMEPETFSAFFEKR